MKSLKILKVLIIDDQCIDDGHYLMITSTNIDCIPIQIQQSTGVETVDEAQKLLEGTEHKMERHLRDWADKWRDTLLIMEENDLGLQKNRSTLRINMDPPHLVLLDDDPLNTSITIFSLKVSSIFRFIQKLSI